MGKKNRSKGNGGRRVGGKGSNGGRNRNSNSRVRDRHVVSMREGVGQTNATNAVSGGSSDRRMEGQGPSRGGGRIGQVEKKTSVVMHEGVEKSKNRKQENDGVVSDEPVWESGIDSGDEHSDVQVEEEEASGSENKKKQVAAGRGGGSRVSWGKVERRQVRGVCGYACRCMSCKCRV
jgi:hypothetical protein